METPISLQPTNTPADFRRLLQQELVKRCRNNPGYSLRAFARALGVEPSALSQILNAKRPITDKMRLRLGSALGLSIEQISEIPSHSSKPNGPALKMQQLALDSFAVISDWYHFAILELTYLREFQADAKWIACRLGLTQAEINIAVERLFRLGLLTVSADQKWQDTSAGGELTQIAPGLTSDAARKYQIQLLDLSKKAIQEVPVKLRSHTSAAFCFDLQDLARAKARIDEFRRSFAREFQPREPNEVYQMQISFYPLTKSQTNGENE